tara:strand:+ start:396 stop:1151 length:756 start_codon:yes stop_codon:yes gene_type:complete
MFTYYAVAHGRATGVFDTWFQCQQQVHRFPGAIYKKFSSKKDALKFIKSEVNNNNNLNNIVESNNDIKVANEDSTLSSSSSSISDTDIKTVFFIYTDGACSNNGHKDAKAGIGVFFAHNDTRNISKLIRGKQTNNAAELHAIIAALEVISVDAKLSTSDIIIVSDSQYAIRCVTEYGEKCEQQQLMHVPNYTLIIKARQLYKQISNIQFMYCPAHTGRTDEHSIGNSYADTLATNAIKSNSGIQHSLITTL